MDKEEVRLVLQQALEGAFPELPVIFRPSGKTQLTYPCVVYEPKVEEPSFANNLPFAVGTKFQVTFISNIPGYSKIREMYSLPSNITNISNQSYSANDLVHDVFIVSVHTI